MAITDSSVLPPAVREYYDRMLLMTAYPTLIHATFAQKKSVPKNVGDTVVMRRFNRLATVPIPLQDGVSPTAVPLSVNDIKARVDWYGNVVVLTDQVEMTVECQALNEATRLLAENLGETIDEICRDVLVSTTTVVQAANGDNGNTPTEMTKEDIDALVTILIGNDAKMISQVIEGTNKFGTAPVRPAFWGMLHSALIDDLEKVSGFQNASYYASQKALESEWGQTGNVRWLYSSIGYVTDDSPAVYHCPVVGREAYAVINLGAQSGEFIVKPLGSSGSDDALNQRGSAGWKHPMACRILNDAFMANFMVTHS